MANNHRCAWIDTLWYDLEKGMVPPHDGWEYRVCASARSDYLLVLVVPRGDSTQLDDDLSRLEMTSSLSIFISIHNKFYKVPVLSKSENNRAWVISAVGFTIAAIFFSRDTIYFFSSSQSSTPSILLLFQPVINLVGIVKLDPILSHIFSNYGKKESLHIFRVSTCEVAALRSLRFFLDGWTIRNLSHLWRNWSLWLVVCHVRHLVRWTTCFFFSLLSFRCLFSLVVASIEWLSNKHRLCVTLLFSLLLPKDSNRRHNTVELEF